MLSRHDAECGKFPKMNSDLKLCREPATLADYEGMCCRPLGHDGGHAFVICKTLEAIERDSRKQGKAL